MSTVPTNPTDRPSSTPTGLPATDVEHDDDGCTTCWTPKLLPCPSWCIGERAHRGEEFSELWDIRTHEAEDLLSIRKPIVFQGEAEDRDVVSVNVVCADNTTTGTREAPGIQVNVSDALSADQVRLLITALEEGLRILGA
jgi:hypothetical protein